MCMFSCVKGSDILILVILFKHYSQWWVIHQPNLGLNLGIVFPLSIRFFGSCVCRGITTKPFDQKAGIFCGFK